MQSLCRLNRLGGLHRLQTPPAGDLLQIGGRPVTPGYFFFEVFFFAVTVFFAELFAAVFFAAVFFFAAIVLPPEKWAVHNEAHDIDVDHTRQGIARARNREVPLSNHFHSQ